jgi:hypothetical protein
MVDSFFLGNIFDGSVGAAKAEGLLVFDNRGMSTTFVVHVFGFKEVGSKMTSLVEFGFAFGTSTRVL